MIKIWNNQGVRILSLTPVQEDVYGLWDMICLSILVKFYLNKFIIIYFFLTII